MPSGSLVISFHTLVWHLPSWGADPALDDARYILSWVQKHGDDSFSRKSCFEGLRGRFPRVELLEPGLELLEHHG